MGKIALPAKSKKADDVVGLLKPREDSLTPTKKAPDVLQHPSPTPKHPLTKTKAGCCRRAWLFSLGVMVVLILFVSTACLVDYQQGNLATHTSQLPKEVREFPRQVGKYVVEVLYQTPKDLHRIFDMALNWTRKNESARPRKKDRSPKFALNDEDLHEIVLDQSKEDIESSVPNGELPKEGNDDTVVDDGLGEVAQFFVGIWKDVAGMFEASNEEELTDVEVTNNAIKRKVDVEESSGRVEMTQPGFNIDDNLADQVHSPGFVEHTTENEDDWNNEVIKVMEEIIDGGTTEIFSDKEKLKNLLNDEGSEKHIH